MAKGHAIDEKTDEAPAIRSVEGCSDDDVTPHTLPSSEWALNQFSEMRFSCLFTRGRIVSEDRRPNAGTTAHDAPLPQQDAGFLHSESGARVLAH